jgi:hypothetical protein
MEFRWIAIIALWACISGPVLNGLWGHSTHAHQPTAKALFAKPRQ